MAAVSSTAAELTSLSQLLHLTHHRNKNQHRLSKWYKSLCQLRRQVSKLLVEVETLDTAISFSSKKDSKYVTVAREKVEVRVGFWQERLFERWYLAFSNLTADNQYASLGLMLLGCLARARTVVRPYSKESEGVEYDMDETVDVSQEVTEDLGEVVNREEHNTAGYEGKQGRKEDHAKLSTQVTKMKKSSKRKENNLERERPPMEKVIKSASANPPKKKKKKGDAFDDLFSGLI